MVIKEYWSVLRRVPKAISSDECVLFGRPETRHPMSLDIWATLRNFRATCEIYYSYAYGQSISGSNGAPHEARDAD
eukprot:802294-Amorphochlora_amoeboformis.AAC.3